MGVIRKVWERLSADAFWDDVKELRWTVVASGAGHHLTVHNPSPHEAELLAVLLRQPADDGPHGAWVSSGRLELSAKRGEPTVLSQPVLRPREVARAWPEEDLTLVLPPTVRPQWVEAIVLTSFFEGQAIKQWRIDEQGVVEVLRDDKVYFSFTGGDLVDGVFKLF